jgi:ketosteroid isomerase-like protein
MKIRLVVALVGSAISFALPTLAQTIDPQLRAAAEAIDKTFDDSQNGGNPAPIIAVFSKDGVVVTNVGPISGQEAITKYYTDLFKVVKFSNCVTKTDPGYPRLFAGKQMWATGEWSNTIKGDNWGPIDQKGYFANILVREGGDWKVRLDIFNVTPPPAK